MGQQQQAVVVVLVLAVVTEETFGRKIRQCEAVAVAQWCR